MNTIILGSAPCVWRDYREAIKLGGFDFFIAVNQTGMNFAPIDAWVTAHTEHMNKWQIMRKMMRLSLPDIVTPNHNTAGRDIKITHTHPYDVGGSSLYAVTVARELYNAGKIVLCGVPLDASGHIGEQGGANGSYEHFMVSWQKYFDDGKLSDVRSMSGNTAKLLGKPTKGWLK